MASMVSKSEMKKQMQARTTHSGLEALLALNKFLGSNRATLLKEQVTGVTRHYSIARGNEGAPAKDLPINEAFGGDIHGKLRSLVGGIGGLVDEAALPETVQAHLLAFRQSVKEYRKHTEVLKECLSTQNVQRKMAGQEKLTYYDLDSLEKAARAVNPELVKTQEPAIAASKGKCFTYFYMLTKAIEACDVLPLHFSSKDGDINVAIKNVYLPIHDITALQLLVVEKMVKDGQFDNLLHPIELRQAGVTTEVSHHAVHLLRELKEYPETVPLVEAVDAKLYSDITHYLDVLDKRYAVALEKQSPRIYNEYVALRRTLEMPEKALDVPASTVAADTITPEVTQSQEKFEEPPRISGCPRHQMGGGFTRH